MNTEAAKKNIRQRHRRFEEDIWDNPSICNNCFARIRVVLSVAVGEYDQLVQNGVPEAVWYRTEDASQGYDVVDSETNALPLYVPRIVCEKCGSVGGRSQPDTISQRRAVVLSERLADRLEEEGYLVDVNLLKDVVGRVKSHQNLQGYDREAFGLATKHATLLPPEDGEEI